MTMYAPYSSARGTVERTARRGNPPRCMRRYRYSLNAGGV